MPYFKGNKKYNKRYLKKKKYKRKAKIGRPSKSLTQSKYFFKRTFTQVITDMTSDPGGDWYKDTTNKTLAWFSNFRLTDLTNYSDFVNMFAMYRINAVKVEFVPQATIIGQGRIGEADFSQMIVYLVPNQVGFYDSANSNGELTEQACLDTQATKKRRWVNGKTLKIYQKVYQLSMRYNTSTNTDYARVKPRFISTAEATTSHVGLCALFCNQAGPTWELPTVPLRMYTTFYIECKGVR